MAVWYLAHPVRSDERFSEEENLEHTKTVQKILWNAGLWTVTPWYSWILINPDFRTPEQIDEFLTMDEETVRTLGRIVLTGHKLSSGMEREFRALPPEGFFLNFIGVPDDLLYATAEKYLRVPSIGG